MIRHRLGMQRHYYVQVRFSVVYNGAVLKEEQTPVDFGLVFGGRIEVTLQSEYGDIDEYVAIMLVEEEQVRQEQMDMHMERMFHIQMEYLQEMETEEWISESVKLDGVEMYDLTLEPDDD